MRGRTNLEGMLASGGGPSPKRVSPYPEGINSVATYGTTKSPPLTTAP